MVALRSLPPLVLVVDDYEDAREIYATCLEHAGFRVAVAADGREAVALALELDPDVIVMDLAMPVMDGWEATRVLKRDPRTRGIRVIAVTGHAGEDIERAAIHAGCDGFFMKPVLPAQLLHSVRRTMGAA
jgi:CheY-like chemotaxis protein